MCVRPISRRGRLSALFVLGLVAALANTSCAGGGDVGSPPTTSTSTAGSPPSTVATVPPSVKEWRLLPKAPLPVGFYAGVWTGTEILVHAPDSSLVAQGSVDAAYDPAGNTWRRLPSSPYPVESVEAGIPAVWNGTEMLTWGTVSAGYNPSTNRWRALSRAPQTAPSVVAWTGSQVLFWGGGCCDNASASGYAYNVAGDYWQPLPQAPLAGRRTGGVWTGTELIIVGGQAHYQTFFPDAAAYNPTTRSWRLLPPLPAPRFDATITWTGTEVLVVGGRRSGESGVYADGMAYNPVTNRWRQLPSMTIGRANHMAVWTGHQLLVWGGEAGTDNGEVHRTPPHGVAYAPTTDSWSAMPPAPLLARTRSIAVWTGTEMVIWGGLSAREPVQQYVDGAAYTP